MIFQYLTTHSRSLFAHRVGTRSNALRRAFAQVNREKSWLSSPAVCGPRAQDIWAQAGSCRTARQKQTCRSNRELPECTVFQLSSLTAKNKHVDYIIKTRSLDAKKHYMVIAMLLSSADSTVHPARGGNVSFYMRLMVLNYVVVYVINHLIKRVYCLATGDGQRTLNKVMEVFSC